MTDELNLSQVFKAVTKTLKENQAALDEADVHNHDHGTNMVNTFKLIEKAVKAKKDAPASEQLAHASKLVREKSTSGSALLYADGLESAAAEFEGKTFDRSGVGTLLNALMGTPQNQPQTQVSATPTAQGGDFLSALMGGLADGQQQAPQPQQQPTFSQTPDLIDALGGLTFVQQQPTQQQQPQQANQGSATDLVASLLGGLGQNQAPTPQQQTPQSSGLGGLLSSLLGGGQPVQQAPVQQLAPSGMGGLGDLLGTLLGGQQSQAPQQPQQGGINTTTLLSAALAYFMAKQQGKTPFESILQAVGTATRFSDREDRTQSGALVANTLIGLLSK